MPVLAGSTINVPSRRLAKEIVHRLSALRDNRRAGRITRAGFLRKWGKLRLALFLTPEYQAMRMLVFIRDKYMCRKCGTVAAEHVHHLKRVAMYPELALEPENCESRCVSCHKAEEHL